jgi:hypothetical protein
MFTHCELLGRFRGILMIFEKYVANLTTSLIEKFRNYDAM